MKQQIGRNAQGQGLAVGLACFSVGLGLAELAAPRRVARLIGVRADAETLSVLRAFGVREIANGIAILADPENPTWMWGRVGGDAVDLISLLQAEKTDPGRTTLATLAGAGVAALDACAAQRLGQGTTGHAQHEVQVTEAVTVNRPIEEVYGFWRQFENFPRFMRHIESIRTEGRKSWWRVVGPAGVRVEWEADLVDDRDNDRISWRTVESSDVEHHGLVRFKGAPGSRGTEVRVHLHYRPPAGRLGSGLAWLLGSDPESQIREDLRRFKQLMEAGEIVLSDGPALWRPARPADRPERSRAHAGVQS